MRIRVFFEPHEKMCINDIKVFKYYGENYLADFTAMFGGYISMNALEKKGYRLEPVWQFIMDDTSTDEVNRLIEYIDHNPMNGYHVHIYEDHAEKLY